MAGMRTPPMRYARRSAWAREDVEDGEGIVRTPGVGMQCLVARGLVKEVEEEINKFLATHDVNVLHMAQSESGEYLSITLIFEELASGA